jgi:hypothetical protein
MIDLLFIKEINDYFLNSDDARSKLISILKHECNIDAGSFKVFLTCNTLKLQPGDDYKREQYIKQYLHNKKKYSGIFDPISKSNKFLYKYNASDSTQMIWTSQSQLLFFKWAIESKFFGMVSKYATEIYKNIYDGEINDILDKYSDDPCLDLIMSSETRYDLSCLHNYAADDTTVTIILHL